MANWRDEYVTALTHRDEIEQANVALYDAYTRLADRTNRRLSPSTSTESPQPKAVSSLGHKTPTNKRNASKEHTTTYIPELLAAMRADLSEAQRSRSELQDRLARTDAEQDKLRKKSAQETRRISVLENDRSHLQLRLKDRDEELKGKAKLLEDLQDELATLNLQLNMVEEQSNRLKKENQELIDRWMARIGREADAMNDASKFS